MEKDFSERLKEELDKLGAQKEIAGELGVSANTLVNATRGYNSPKVSLLLDIQVQYPSFDAAYVLTGRRASPQLHSELRSAQERIEELQLSLIHI